MGAGNLAEQMGELGRKARTTVADGLEEEVVRLAGEERVGVYFFSGFGTVAKGIGKFGRFSFLFLSLLLILNVFT